MDLVGAPKKPLPFDSKSGFPAEWLHLFFSADFWEDLTMPASRWPDFTGLSIVL